MSPASDPSFLSGASPFKEELGQALSAAGVDRASAELLGPYSDLARHIGEAIYESFLPGARTNSLYWPLLLLTVLLAVAFFLVRGGRGARGADGHERACGLREYLLPRSIYTHPSARVDIGLYLLDRALMPVWVTAALGAIAPAVERGVIQSLQYWVGAGPGFPVTLGWKLGYGLMALLTLDMTFYFTHLFGHRTRVGWAFHKVHHSAEVLTPLTRYREHFVEGILYASTGAVAAGLSGGLFAYLLGGHITAITVMNLGVFAFLYALTGNFRHYHVSLRFPRWLERWLQSPGMHHVHHSTSQQHWDKNLGLVTSIWDRLCGTLYIGEPYEPTPWGLQPADQARYRTFSENLWEPFREVGGIFKEVKAGLATALRG